MTIKSFEIAKLFGLKYNDDDFHYEFDLHGQVFYVLHGMGDDEAVDEDEAKEMAAKRVLLAIGKSVAVSV